MNISCTLLTSFIGLKSAEVLDKTSPQAVPQQQQQSQEHITSEQTVPPIEKRSGDHKIEKPVHHRQGSVIPVDNNSCIPHGIALYDYESHENGTLKFKRGDTIRLKRKLDNLWYIGEVQHVEGVFPINLIHVNPVDPSKPQKVLKFSVCKLFSSRLD